MSIRLMGYRPWIVITLLLIILSILFVRMRTATPSSQYIVFDTLMQIQHLNATLNEQILVAHSQQFHNYDLLVHSLSELHRQVELLAHAPCAFCAQNVEEIDHLVATLQRAVKEKSVLIEDFQSDNAVYKNSLNYFFKISMGFANSAENRSENYPQGVEAAPVYTHQIQIKILAYLLGDGRSTPPVINRILQELGQAYAAQTGQSKLLARNVLMHTRQLLDYNQRVQQLTEDALTVPISELALALDEHYVEHFQYQSTVAANYRISLLLLAFFLAGYVVVILLKLRRRSSVLNQTVAELAAEKELAQVTLHSIGDGVITTDAKGRVDYLNPVAQQLTGWRYSEAKKEGVESVCTVVDELTEELLEHPVQHALQQGEPVSSKFPVRLLNKDGNKIAIMYSVAPICGDGQAILGAVLVLHDVSQESALKLKLSYQATHDTLTDLVNRREFEQRLSEAIRDVCGERAIHALLYLDLDQFKVVNDTCGHQAGDELLKQLSGLLHDQIRGSDVVARLGGDEFGVLLHNCPLDKANAIAENLRRMVADFRFSWEGQNFRVGVSIGLVIIDKESRSSSEVLGRADAACYAAKDSGRNRIHQYQATNTDLLQRRKEMSWVNRIHSALDENRLCLYQQPVQSIKEGEAAIMHEVLIRMQDEKSGLVLPSAFLPAAERYDLMPVVDRWVVSNTLAHMSKIEASSPYQESWAINLSGQSISDVDFLSFVQEQFQQYGVPPRRVIFEITESAAIANLQKAARFIKALQALGVHFALDDFGSGLSSFTYLKNLPVDYLKICGAFVKDIDKDPVDFAMVEAINQVGHVMGIKTIAEHAETAAVLDCLRLIGVDFAQGFAIAEPVPIKEPLPSK